MTIDELAARMDAQFETVEKRFEGLDKRFEGLDKKVEGLDKKVEGLDKKVEGLDKKVGGLDKKVGGLDKKVGGLDKKVEGLDEMMGQGFNDSKIRDEKLRELMTFGLEAREVLRDEMHRRFDEVDQKHNQQIALLQDSVRHLTSRK